MKVVIKKVTGLLLLVGVISTCSVDNGSVAGIGGSGYVATGTITGFGSVFVNGIKFETGSTIFDVDDDDASQDALRIGMVVRVHGSVNADGITGTANRIVYDNNLEGPIEEPIVTNPDGTKTFIILGTTVIVDSGDTVFVDTTFASLALDDMVEISGLYTASDEIRATLVEFNPDPFSDDSTIVEIKGVISNLSGTTFDIGNIEVNAVATNLTDLPGGLVNGVYVEVKGTYNRTTKIITAEEVEAEENELGSDGESASIEGYITRYSSLSDFDVDGHAVNAFSAVLNPSNLTLSLGDRVEVEGTINNGVLRAKEVELHSGT